MLYLFAIIVECGDSCSWAVLWRLDCCKNALEPAQHSIGVSFKDINTRCASHEQLIHAVSVYVAPQQTVDGSKRFKMPVAFGKLLPRLLYERC